MCKSWSEHEWGPTRLLLSGTDPRLGRYHRYVVRCEGCDKVTTETHWLDLPMRPEIEERRMDT